MEINKGDDMENRISLKSISLVLVLTLVITSLFVPVFANKDVYAAAKTGLSFKKTTVNKGETVQLSLSIAKADAKKKIKWSSSKKKVASVNKAGLVTAKKAGKAKITAKVGKKKYKCTVTVVNAGKGTIKSPYIMKKGPVLTWEGGTNGVVKNTATLRNEAVIAKLKGMNYWDDGDQLSYDRIIAKYDLVGFELNINTKAGWIDGTDVFNGLYTKGMGRSIENYGFSTIYRKGGYNDGYGYDESGKAFTYAYIEKGQSSFITNIIGPNGKIVWLQYSY